MRGIVYAVACLAAAGIMYAIAVMPDGEGANSNPEVASASASEAMPSKIMAEAGTLVLSVPSMHCEVACYPRVKKSLEETDGVSEVALDKQKEEGVLDNRQVVIEYEAGFDLAVALANLSKEGFEDANVVQ